MSIDAYHRMMDLAMSSLPNYGDNVGRLMDYLISTFGFDDMTQDEWSDLEHDLEDHVENLEPREGVSTSDPRLRKSASEDPHNILRKEVPAADGSDHGVRVISYNSKTEDYTVRTITWSTGVPKGKDPPWTIDQFKITYRYDLSKARSMHRKGKDVTFAQVAAKLLERNETKLAREVLSLTWQEEEQEIERAIKQFPAEFGLKAFPENKFRISPSASYVSDGIVMLYTEIYKNNHWMDFAKGTINELKHDVMTLDKKALTVSEGDIVYEILDVIIPLINKKLKGLEAKKVDAILTEVARQVQISKNFFFPYSRD